MNCFFIKKFSFIKKEGGFEGHSEDSYGEGDSQGLPGVVAAVCVTDPCPVEVASRSDCMSMCVCLRGCSP